MAPQQNSTFIEDDSMLRLKMHSNFGVKDTEESEIIERYSPIMPPKATRQFNESDEKEDCLTEKIHPQSKNCKTHRRDVGEAKQKDHHNDQKQSRNAKENFNDKYPYGRQTQSRHTRRSRSISLNGANSTMEKGQKEISIWVGNEPRYVSGVTMKTTCNDIIKALIDDEIRNGNPAFRKNLEEQRIYSKDDGDGVCATSRDCNDYVITECWRGIERSYDGNMTILPVWKAWSRVHNEVRLMLRRRSEITNPLQQYPEPKKRPSLLRKYLRKLTQLWRKDKPTKDLSKKPSNSLDIRENCLLSHKAAIPDELLFVILPDKVYEKGCGQSGARLELIPEDSDKTDSKIMFKKRNRLRSMRRHHKSTASRKRCERGVCGVSANDCIRRRQLTAAGKGVVRNSIRYRLAQKTSEMDALYAREYALTRELSEKCKLYRLQNQIYSNPEHQWNISIGQVQRKIENYAQEIVRTENELLELKNEINQDISLINNLKRMTLDRGCDVLLAPTDHSKKPDKSECEQGDMEAKKEMQFVDNIYEFCDNNASMLV